jgi:hypothetical protein
MAEPVCRDAASMASILGISPHLLRRQAKAGKIPHVYVGDRLLFIEDQVLDHLRGQAAASVRPDPPVADVPRKRPRRIVQAVSRVDDAS